MADGARSCASVPITLVIDPTAGTARSARTRLELLAAGVEETTALGPSLTPLELWDEAVPQPIGDRAIRYKDLLPPLRARGLSALCRVLEERIDAYQARVAERARWSGI